MALMLNMDTEPETAVMCKDSVSYNETLIHNDQFTSRI